MSHSPGTDSHWKFRKRRMAAAAVFPALALMLQMMGQPIYCACQQFQIWNGDTWSSHNSQHFLDWYSLTHVSHGLLMAGGTWLLLRKLLNFRGRLLVCLLLEAGWELLENTPLIVQRYRTATVALGYTGDSIVNSIGDLLSCFVGFLLASTLGFRKTVVLLIALELLLLVVIRDNLTLNMVMLSWPLDAIREWQAAGH